MSEKHVDPSRTFFCLHSDVKLYYNLDLKWLLKSPCGKALSPVQWYGNGWTSKIFSLLGHGELLKNWLSKEIMRLPPPSLPTFDSLSTKVAVLSFFHTLCHVLPQALSISKYLKPLLFVGCSLISFVTSSFVHKGRTLPILLLLSFGRASHDLMTTLSNSSQNQTLCSWDCYVSRCRVLHICRTTYIMIFYDTIQCLSKAVFLTFRFLVLKHT